MTTLKEETIKGLQAENKFCMSDFGDAKDILTQNRGRKNYCGTASCIAGHIVAAAARLGRKVPKELVNDGDRDKETGSWNDPGETMMQKLGLSDEFDTTARSARYLWAKSYGKDRANKLDFYAETFGGPDGKYSVDLGEVTATEAIEYIKTA